MIQEEVNGSSDVKKGEVEASFTVDETGKIMEVKIVKSLNIICDEAVRNAIGKLPTFVQVSPEKRKTMYTLKVPFE
jgi:outer membrane biosynthesis protein TonB